MALSNELINAFVKATNDKTEIKQEVTVYGTVFISDGVRYVTLDGSTELTPVSSLVTIADGDRVKVSIKDHRATVTGNLSSVSASSSDVITVTNEVTTVKTLAASKVDTTDLDAVVGRVEILETTSATIKNLEAAEARIYELDTDIVNVNKTLTAQDASIKSLETEKIDVDFADAKYATIENLEATDASVHNLEATYGDFQVLTSNKLTAIDAEIDDLEANKLDAADAEIVYAKITDLDAVEADIDALNADVANIDTLIFGSASGNTIQTSFANAVMAQLGNAQIKAAMIENVSADKIASGDILTNNVHVKSQNGLLLISDETIQISDDDRVRVQIGKDASNDYSINIWDAEGNLMFSKGGITDSAIKDAIIRNDMVSDTANIAAHKLDIDSLFEEINGSSKTIKSTRVHLDEKGQTLDVAFGELTSTVEEQGETITSQGTAITAIQGQITSKVWQLDINTAKGEMSTQYSTLEQEVDNVSATVANHTTQISNKADTSKVTEVNDKVTSLETDLNGFRTTVTKTYTTKTEFEDLTIGGRNYFVKSKINNLACGNADDEHPHGKILTNPWFRGYSFQVSEGEQWCLYRTDTTNNRWGVYWFAEEPALNVSAVAYGFRSDNQAANVANYLTVPTGVTWGFIYLSNNIDEGAVPNIMLEKSTKPSDWSPAPEDVDDDILAVHDEVVLIEERLANAETSIFQNTEVIGLKASKTEVSTAKTEAIAAASTDAQTKANKALSDANANTSNLLTNYSTTSQMQAAITASADSITSSVKNTYATIKTVENIEIGGRNYFRPANVVDLGCTGAASGVQTLTSTGACVSFYVPTVPGDVWSLSRATTENNRFDYCFTIEEPASDVQIYNWISNHREDLVIEGITTPADCNYLFIYLSNQKDQMPDIKLEKGNKATDWSPAPEDMATSDELATVQSSASLVETRVTTAESLIQQLSDSIMTLVTDSNGESLMVQNGEGWTFSTAQIQSAIENASNNLNKLTDDMGDVNTTVNALKGAVDDLGILNDYVKIGTYENEPCIELGESDNEFKLIITNTRIMFMEGSGVPAYINNQSLYIKKAVVEEELQQGDFVWQIRSNGNLGLIWKG